MWHLSVDTGGTFTDCLAIDPSGKRHRAKVLSSSALRAIVERVDGNRIRINHRWGDVLPSNFCAGMGLRGIGSTDSVRIDAFDSATRELAVHEPLLVGVQPGDIVELLSDEPAPILAARLVSRTAHGRPLPPMSLRLATTRGTNALLERNGAATALFITRGFRDLLLIRDQQRPDIFALDIIKPKPLYEAVVEVDERLASDGCVLRPCDHDAVRQAAMVLRGQGIQTAAIAFMHGYLNPEHERLVARVLRECGFQHVAVSSDLAPMIRIVPRAQTAVVEAYLAPLVSDYLEAVERAQGSPADSALAVMTSAGGLAPAASFRAFESLLSGPAGGVAGAAAVGRAAGFPRIIGFDMGGTSTDVCRFDNDFNYVFQHTVGDATILAPAMAIETVAAGGGSICEFRDGRFRVGPQSAGAHPGPACYAAGGPFTLTDVNLLLGRIDPNGFEIPLDVGAAHDALQRVLESTRSAGISCEGTEALLAGFLDIANERMAEAIAEVSTRQGVDPRDYALVAFGGAGGQHACAIASRLGMRTIILPEEASFLSAAGLRDAAIERFAQRQILQPLETMMPKIRAVLAEIENEATTAVAEALQSLKHAQASIAIRRRIIAMRLVGQDSTIAVESEDLTQLAATFRARYREIHGYSPADRPIEIESIRVVASTVKSENRAPHMTPVQSFPTSRRDQRAWLDGRWSDIATFEREAMQPGDQLPGPALVIARHSVAVIESGWAGRVDAENTMVLERVESSKVVAVRQRSPRDPIELELFTNRFLSVAAEMGQVLERTAVSTNVKERLDFSCTVLDAKGYLVANAPHLPVHIGALGLCVREVIRALPMQPGDVIVTNHPVFGGSHLPDITVITPAFTNDSRRPTLIGYVASRAHHAEIGGARPGSMPPDATRLVEEGVIIPPMKLIDAGESRFDAMERLLRSGPYPSRAPLENIADLHAAVAANQRGVDGLRSLAHQHGIDRLADAMSALADRAEALARSAISRLPHSMLRASDAMDDGSAINLTVHRDADALRIDFTGSAPIHPGNLNCTPAVVRSAVIYALRLLIGERLPLNEGIMRAVEIVLPQGMLNPDFSVSDDQLPAVVGGNTETSQRLVDTLLRGFGLAASSQGTMNNTLFGNDRFGYYETVCGGAGATIHRAGADAVHTHMTNTRITDPEILEQRYPVRLDRFEIRPNSGGEGAQRGGSGVTREITFLAPMALSLLTQRRTLPPPGLAGGSPGQPGRQLLIRADGAIEQLRSIDGHDVFPNDRLILETPGGGGYGDFPLPPREGGRGGG